MENLILTDSLSDELDDFKRGLEESTNEKWNVYSSVSNWGRTSFWKKIKRLFIYFLSPLKVFFRRKKYSKIIGWQQFYALIYCFYCRLFHAKKVNKVFVVNFTYKKKKGIVGKIYYRFMKYILQSKYIDLLYVPSYKYISECSEDFKISEDLFRTLPFGVPDLYEKYKDKTIDKDFILSIGRSNRDYDWLITKWNEINYPLFVISDTYKPTIKVPSNVTIIDNISGDKQYPYLVSCKALILPIDIENICSGDTVLLTAMSFKKNVIVTKGSTLSEMYIINGKDGFVVNKKNDELIKIVSKIISNTIDLGDNARKKFINNYSRYKMGENIGKTIEEAK